MHAIPASCKTESCFSKIDHGYFKIADAGDKSEVTWGFKGENDFVSRVFSVFMSTENAVGPMFEKGLEILNALVSEDIGKEYSNYKVNLVDFPGRTFAE